MAPLLAELDDALADVDFEVLAVDDGSTDGSLEELRRLRSDRANLRILSLDRRCGQSAAVIAGLDHARGHLVAMLDADGQNDPADLPRLLATVERGGADAVVGYRARRADGVWKRVQARVGNAVRNRITGDVVRDTGCSMRVAPRDALRRLPRFDGMHRFIPTLLRLDGARIVEIDVTHRPRRHGRTKYGMWNRLWVGLRDVFGVRWLRRRRLHYRVREEGGGV